MSRLPLLLLSIPLLLSVPITLAAADVSSMMGTMAPDGTMSRAEAVLYLYKQFQSDLESDPTPVPQVSFMDLPSTSPLLPLLARFCVAEAISCTGGDFMPDQPASMPAVLKMYDHLLHHYNQVPMEGLSKEKQALPTWNEEYMHWGEEHGLVPKDMLMIPVTHGTMEKFLAKDTYLRSWYYTLPTAYPRLPESLDQVNDTNIKTKDDLNTMRDLVQRSNLSVLERLMEGTSPFRKPQDILVSTKLGGLRSGMDQLALFMDQHPLYYDGSFTEEERKEFRDLGLQEIIGVGDYDFRTNPAYRKHNIRATLKNVHKLVLQPDEEFDYWKVMYAKGLNDIVNGWLIVEGKEVWGWGGGLCGTATTIFRAAWFSGLEITERQPHTNYYNSLYGRNDMGLDATVYQDWPNLRFKNNTGHPLMLYLRYNETEDFAHLMVLGTKHFTNFEFIKGTRRGRSINHERIVTLKDGTVWKDELYSTYKQVE